MKRLLCLQIVSSLSLVVIKQKLVGGGGESMMWWPQTQLAWGCHFFIKYFCARDAGGCLCCQPLALASQHFLAYLSSVRVGFHDAYWMGSGPPGQSLSHRQLHSDGPLTQGGTVRFSFFFRSWDSVFLGPPSLALKLKSPEGCLTSFTTCREKWRKLVGRVGKPNSKRKWRWKTTRYNYDWL